MEALSNAGLRIDKTAAISEEYDVAFNKYMDDPTNVDLKNRVEELEAKHAAASDYQTLIEKGDQQVAYLKALDCVDALGPRLRLYNVCRAKTLYNMEKGCHCSCGMAYPAKMWKQPDKTAWTWICQVDWMPCWRSNRGTPNTHSSGRGSVTYIRSMERMWPAGRCWVASPTLCRGPRGVHGGGSQAGQWIMDILCGRKNA